MHVKKSGIAALAGLVAIGLAWAVSTAAAAGDYDGESGAAVAKMLPSAKVRLQQALTAAEKRGKPISAKFEFDEGRFQLSVYTAKGEKFSEVLVDYNRGTIAKSEDINEGEDLANAKTQAEAMGHAKRSLKAAVDRAERKVAGGRAVSVTPTVTDGHPQALVTVFKAGEYQSVSEPLE